MNPRLHHHTDTDTTVKSVISLMAHEQYFPSPVMDIKHAYKNKHQCISVHNFDKVKGKVCKLPEPCSKRWRYFIMIGLLAVCREPSSSFIKGGLPL